MDIADTRTGRVGTDTDQHHMTHMKWRMAQKRSSQEYTRSSWYDQTQVRTVQRHMEHMQLIQGDSVLSLLHMVCM